MDTKISIQTWQDLQKYRDAFIAYLKTDKKVSSHTQRAYASDIDQCIEFWIALPEEDQAQLSCRQIIEKFLAGLTQTSIRKRSIARKYSCFSSFEKYLHANHVMVTLNLVRPSFEQKAPIYFSLETITHLLDEVPEKMMPSKRPVRDKAIFELMYATGIRSSELVAIRLQDLDLESKTILIFGRKAGRTRTVLFGSKAQERLQAYIEGERMLERNASSSLFLNQRGDGLTTRSVQRIIAMFRRFLKMDGPLTPHKLRHSYAAHLLSVGAEAEVVQALLGHVAPASIEKYANATCKKG